MKIIATLVVWSAFLFVHGQSFTQPPSDRDIAALARVKRVIEETNARDTVPILARFFAARWKNDSGHSLVSEDGQFWVSLDSTSLITQIQFRRQGVNPFSGFSSVPQGLQRTAAIRIWDLFEREGYSVDVTYKGMDSTGVRRTFQAEWVVDCNTSIRLPAGEVTFDVRSGELVSFHLVRATQQTILVPELLQHELPIPVLHERALQAYHAMRPLQQAELYHGLMLTVPARGSSAHYINRFSSAQQQLGREGKAIVVYTLGANNGTNLQIIEIDGKTGQLVSFLDMFHGTLGSPAPVAKDAGTVWKVVGLRSGPIQLGEPIDPPRKLRYKDVTLVSGKHAIRAKVDMRANIAQLPNEPRPRKITIHKS